MRLGKAGYGSSGGASAYAAVGLETGVAAASRHQLIGMLFDGVLAAIAQAREAIAARDHARRGAAISRAIDIIDNGLRASLDRSAGELAERLDELYEYIGTRLLAGSMAGDAAPLDECARLLAELRDAWSSIAATPAAARAPAGRLQAVSA